MFRFLKFPESLSGVVVLTVAVSVGVVALGYAYLRYAVPEQTATGLEGVNTVGGY